MSRPFVCNVNAMSAADRLRHDAVFGQLRAALMALTELPNGYEYHFPSDPAYILLAAEFITRERLCCPFLSFALEVPPETNALTLSLTGPEGVTPFLREALGLNSPEAQ
jgi:hypothetical protein